jgi:hypothetical protein
MYVAPKIVSGRVVKTTRSEYIGPNSEVDVAPDPELWIPSSNVISAPSLRPIQFRCAVRVVSDQSILSRLFSRRSEYSLMRKNRGNAARPYFRSVHTRPR